MILKIPLVPGAEIEKESVTQAPRLLKAPAPTAVSPINVVAVTLYVDTQIIRLLTLNITWIIHDKSFEIKTQLTYVTRALR